MLSESGMRRCDCRNPLAPRSPVTLRICSAKTGVYSTQCPSPSTTGCVSPLRISSGVWCELIWRLREERSEILRESMPPRQPKSKPPHPPQQARELRHGLDRVEAMHHLEAGLELVRGQP